MDDLVCATGAENAITIIATTSTTIFLVIIVSANELREKR
jgi:hypothetical protein